MKPDVSPVTLIATQELGNVPGTPTTADFYTHWPNGAIRGYKNSIANLAQMISSELGSGSLLPERRYLIDTNMPSGSTYEVNGDGNGQINDPYLDGKVYDVHRNGLLISKGYIWQNDVVGGGIRLLQPNDTFELGEEVVISFQPAFSPYIPTPDAIARFSNGERIITATSAIGGADFRKLIILRGAANILTITLPAASAYPENVLFAIISDGGNHKQATLRCTGSDNIAFNSSLFPDFWLGQNEQILLIPAVVSGIGTTPNGWRVIQFSGAEHFGRLGVTDMGCLQGPNHWNAATNPGPQLRAVYPRSWWFITKMQAAQPSLVVSGAAWNANQTFWGTGDGSTTFNFPYKAGYFPRYLDPDGEIDDDRFNDGNGNLPGSTEEPSIGNHTHSGFEADNSAHDSSSLPASPPTIPATKLLVNLDTRNRNGHTSIQGAKIGANDGFSYETRPYNIGELPLINI